MMLHCLMYFKLFSLGLLEKIETSPHGWLLGCIGGLMPL